MRAALLEAPERRLDISANGHRDSDSNYEIIDGVEVELPPMSAESTVLASDLGIEIGVFIRPLKLGRICFDTLIKLNLPNGRERSRKPDFFFVSYKKWPQDKPIPKDRDWEIVPDLCVEVISPTDGYSDVEKKVSEYFDAGIPQVWIIDPESQKFKVYESSDQVKILRPKDTLMGGEILPGFELPLNRLFLNKPDRED